MNARSLMTVFAVLAALCLVPALAGAAEPTHDELVKLAQKEGKLTIYSNSSRHSKAGEAFEKKYGIKVHSSQLKDMEIIEKISKEAAAGIAGADLVFAQDSGRVYGELIARNYLKNYVPPTMADKLGKEDADPLVFFFTVKAIIFNNEKSGAPITNLWQLTDPEWKGRVQMKDAFQEGVNMNFLTMLTRPDVADKLAAAHKAHYGKDLVLTTPNAGYEWIKRLYKNGLVLGTSDTKIFEAVGARGQEKQLAALVTINKMRTAESKKLSLDVVRNAEPFVGFYYPMYCMLPANSVNVNAARLFTEFVLTQEGFEPWVDSLGDYSPSRAIETNKDDFTLAEWATRLVREDPTWCFEHRAEVEDFLNGIM